MRCAYFFRHALALCLIIATGSLTGCGGGGGYGRLKDSTAEYEISSEQQSDDVGVNSEASNNTPETSFAGQNLPAVRVSILLPLSGKHAELGKSLLQSAQMALFDAGYSNFELIPRDTGDSPEKARQAAQSAIDSGAQLILGPVFSSAVSAVKPMVQNAGINMIVFSNDWKLAGNGTFVMGFTPFDQVDRIMGYASSQNIHNIGIIAPESEYGKVVEMAARSSAQRYDSAITAQVGFPQGDPNYGFAIQNFSAASSNVQAVLLPVNKKQASEISSRLTASGFPALRVLRLGTGLLDEGVDSGFVGYTENLEGVLFAAPAPELRNRFEERFMTTYGSIPPRIATLSYDAMALAVALARRGFEAGSAAPAYDNQSITDPNGFLGVDGIFRFRINGTAERGLAILAFQNGKTVVVENAPETFQSSEK